MQIKAITLLIAVTAVLWMVRPGYAADDPTRGLRFMTEDYPPFNYLENGQLTGISVDLLEQIFIKLGSRKTRDDVMVHPWARGYHTVMTVPNTVLFVMTRNPRREGLVQWVGPVAASPIVLLARKEQNLKINSVEDIADYSVVAIKSDIADLVLDEHKVPASSRQIVPYPDIAARMLASRRIDMWSYGKLAALWLLKQEGANPSEFEVVWNFGSAGDNFYAFHIDTSEEVVKAFQEALDALKSDGQNGEASTYDRILEKYMR
ncbi:substrate-binding periplasmic protein [Hahella ganghwensis]|uniref:substrate-binding periplasmic protein n=1 Tax=Hahella ganghwensis TaxID=286420 RepID=UPI00036EFC9F|nr:ABC transporter substrate-binding protein [Hahella ganghwensis]